MHLNIVAFSNDRKFELLFTLFGFYLNLDIEQGNAPSEQHWPMPARQHAIHDLRTKMNCSLEPLALHCMPTLYTRTCLHVVYSSILWGDLLP